ncbi:MAG: hypothetical protein DWQ19_12725 [Crenarchaeota archaeon]|nr:MAG: hypothetical protein DWQ19_12725 [Thermoproteota archaeon]
MDVFVCTAKEDMSVLICSICEENRKPITNALENVTEILGTKAEGNSPWLKSSICQSCHGVEKSFNYSYQLTANKIPFDMFVRFRITSDSLGNYKISLKDNPDQLADINLLNIINQIKKNLENPKEFKAYSFVNFKTINVQGNLIKCKCGNNGFLK